MKEFNKVKAQLENEKENSLKKEIAIDQMKNTQEGGKILNQY